MSVNRFDAVVGWRPPGLAECCERRPLKHSEQTSLKSEQILTRDHGGIGTVSRQIVRLEYAGADRNDPAARALGGANIVRSIAEKAHGCARSEALRHFLHAFSKDIDPQLAIVREASELEKIGKSCRLQLEPGNRFKVAGTQAQKFA